MATNNAINQVGPTPYFSAYKSTDSLNATGNGDAFKVICDTELVDIGNNFNNVTGVFLAPFAGTYVFGCSIAFVATATGGGALMSYFDVSSITTVNTLIPTKFQFPNFYGVNGWIIHSSALSITLAANDQVSIYIVNYKDLLI
jgi:hypothetical protein